MHDASNPSLASLQMRKDVLSPGQLKRIEALWQTAQWPDATDVAAKAGYQPSFGSYLKRVRHLGLSGGLLLDAGCGGGQWSFAWATRFDRVIGFDIASKRILAANRQKERFDIPAVEFIIGDVRNIPAADQSADALYCNDVISGAGPLEPVLKEFFRVLKPSGLCYLGLTELGSAYEHATGGVPHVADFGRRRIYNTLCQRYLLSLVSVIGPGWARNAEAATYLERGMSPTDLLTRLNCRPDQILAAETIADGLGLEFSRTLLDDLTAINAGTSASFGERAAWRLWDVDEVSAAAAEAGFVRTEWAPDGWLSLKRDGSIEKAPCDEAGPRDHEFEARLRAFEMLLWKPPGETSRDNNRAGIAHVGPVGNERITRGPEASWKLTAGNTTYWNAESRELLLPIIESKPPAHAEFEGAIITARQLEPTSGNIRFSTGGVYDRNHNLLPSFLDREAYETTEKKLIRTINDHVLSHEKVVNAKLLRGKYVYLGILRRHFGHFLLESLSHVWYLLKADPSIKILFHQHQNLDRLPLIAKYIFDLIGLTPDRIIIVEQTSVVEHLIFPESEFELRWKARNSYADTFTEFFERSSRRFPIRPTPRNIYLTRRHLVVGLPENIRKIVVNEIDVEALFAKRGFTIIAPEKLSVHEQIAIAAGADQIAGLKGSALHLSLFCQRPKARLVQIGHEQSMNHTLIDGLKNMESHQILCKFVPADAGRVVDLETIHAALSEM